jgi:hypothetical protein
VVQVTEVPELLGEQLDGTKGVAPAALLPGMPATGFKVTPPVGVTVNTTDFPATGTPQESTT